MLSALMLGAAGAPHCAAMCGPACAVLTRGGQASSSAAFQLARVASYALAGAVVASSVGALAWLGQASPALRPLWTLAHAAALALGLWLLWQGRQPAWLARVGRGSTRASDWQPVALGGTALNAGATARPASGGLLRAGAAGGLWAAWPCGLLHSALVVAALANSAAGGAGVMAGFALASAPGLVAAPWLWRRLGDSAKVTRWATRAAGGLLAGVSAWALGGGVWHQVAAYCGF